MTLLHAAVALGTEPSLSDVLTAWHMRLNVAVVVAGAGAFYLTGWGRLRGKNATAAPVSSLVLYLTGLVAIAVSLLSPIDALAERLLTMHMVQHVLLMMIAPALLLLANPFPVVLWTFPRPLRRGMGRLLAADALPRRIVERVTFMPVAWSVSMAILWGWHLPAAYDTALRVRIVHDLEHLSFFAAGFLFWWPLINPAPRVHGHIAHGWRLGYVMVSVGFGMLPSITLGLFARRVFYPYYLTVPRMWGLTPLDDQAMGWGLMAVLNGLVYAVAFMSVVARLAAHEERTLALQEIGGPLTPGAR